MMPINSSNWNSQAPQSGLAQQPLPNIQQVPIQFQPQIFSQSNQFFYPPMLQPFHPQHQSTQFYHSQGQPNAAAFNPISTQSQLSALTHSMPQPPQQFTNMSQQINSPQLQVLQNQVVPINQNLNTSTQSQNPNSPMINNQTSSAIQHPTSSPSLNTGVIRPVSVSPSIGIGQFNPLAPPLQVQPHQLTSQTRLSTPVLSQQSPQVMMMMNRSPTPFGPTTFPGQAQASFSSSSNPTIHPYSNNQQQIVPDITRSSIGLGIGIPEKPNPISENHNYLDLKSAK